MRKLPTFAELKAKTVSLLVGLVLIQVLAVSATRIIGLALNAWWQIVVYFAPILLVVLVGVAIRVIWRWVVMRKHDPWN
jgi:uncharacterized membrane protein YhdT